MGRPNRVKSPEPETIDEFIAECGRIYRKQVYRATIHLEKRNWKVAVESWKMAVPLAMTCEEDIFCREKVEFCQAMLENSQRKVV